MVWPFVLAATDELLTPTEELELLEDRLEHAAEMPSEQLTPELVEERELDESELLRLELTTTAEELLRLDGAEEDETTAWQSALVPHSQITSSIASSEFAAGKAPSTLAILNNADIDCSATKLPRSAETGTVACAQSPLRTKP